MFYTSVRQINHYYIIFTILATGNRSSRRKQYGHLGIIPSRNGTCIRFVFGNIMLYMNYSFIDKHYRNMEQLAHDDRAIFFKKKCLNCYPIICVYFLIKGGYLTSIKRGNHKKIPTHLLNTSEMNIQLCSDISEGLFYCL